MLRSRGDLNLRLARGSQAAKILPHSMGESVEFADVDTVAWLDETQPVTTVKCYAALTDLRACAKTGINGASFRVGMP
jgi:hypothetical protein